MGVGALGLATGGCTVGPTRVPVFDTGFNPRDVGPADSAIDAYVPHDVGNDIGHDAPVDAFFNGDAACESATSQATLTRLPADIIWVIDNSNSMVEAIAGIQAGINDFAATLVASDLDYRMIMISMRSLPAPLVGHRVAVCVPEPLAGPGCADSARFFQVEVDIHSTMPLEQLLGTLGQTSGYTNAAGPASATTFSSPDYGGPPWRSLLRDGATRTIVLVADDNQRTCAMPGASTCLATDPPFTATSLEDFPGGGNPFSSRTLGPGILDATAYPGLFTGYTFDAIYGWGDATDPTVRCTYPGGTQPPTSGQTYTTLVARTGGVRAQICDGAAAFPPFFTAIAASVVHGSPIECTVTIPAPPAGMTFQAGRVNVIVRAATDQTYVGHVSDLVHCDATRGGWYYDDNAAPSHILLCPTSCTAAQSMVVGAGTGLDVQFGCQSILI